MKKAFRSVRLSKQNMERLTLINSIIEEYQEDGFVLTLRQLYYQLVSRDVIPNQPAEYSKLSNLLKEGRLGGIVDWDAIEDRLRVPKTVGTWDNPQQIIRAALKSYKKDRREGQETYLEVWVEKDALSGVLSRVTDKYHVPIMVNRGYSSVTAMYDAYKRFKEQLESGKKVVILYLGDFDPSGQDMIRDIRDRLIAMLMPDIESDIKFGMEQYMEEKGIGIDALDTDAYIDYAENLNKERQEKLLSGDGVIKVEPIALTMDQIMQYNPPVNPAKIKDPRAKHYIDTWGEYSWEVDALKPEVLNRLLTEAILSHTDVDKMNEVANVELAELAELKSKLGL